MKRFVLALATAASPVLPAGPALAGAPDSPDDVVQAAFLSGWREAGGTRMTALSLTLADHWKTYWRAPGDAGVPPVFDFSGSENLASAQIEWPRPQVFDLNGMTTIGYREGVTLPLALTPKDPSKPIRLRATVDIGVCNDICMPVSFSFSADLAGGGAPDPQINAALAARPATGPAAGIRHVSCTVEPIPDGLRVTAQLDVPPLGGAETTVFETPDPTIWVSDATTRREGGRLVATADLVPSSGTPFALDRSALRITVLSPNRAVEAQGCAGE